MKTEAVVNYGGIPFELKRKEPNKLTISAMKELDDGKGIIADNLEITN